MIERTIHKTVRGRRTVDGAGVHLLRVLGYNDVKQFDPFLLLDAFDSRSPDEYLAGFPMHPHRGIETVTYLIDGAIKHKDSLGNSGEIVSGSCQWMTAGSGILHQEMPVAVEHLLGLQLWINLPHAAKMEPPKYRNLTAGAIPEVRDNGAVVRVLAGNYKNTRGAMFGDYVKALYLDVALEGGEYWSVETPPMDTAFVYVISGDLAMKGGEVLPARQAALLNYGDMISVKAGSQGARFMVASAAPLKEPVAWGGPIVMNTEDELRTAFMELENGNFIKHGSKCGENC